MLESKVCWLKSGQKYFNLHINQVYSCCSSYPEPFDSSVDQLVVKWKQEQQDLAQGIQLPGCEMCWKKEQQGLISLRLLQGQTPLTERIELNLSNLCNHQCSYCSPKLSSKWEESISEFGLFSNVRSAINKNFELQKHKLDQDKLQQIQNYILQQKDNSVDLVITGGEPLMQKANLELLLGLVSQKVKNLHVITNLNPPTNKFLLWLLDNIDSKKIKFAVSLDATPEFNHIPRSGFDQQRFLKNFEILQKADAQVYFLSTVSALGIFDAVNFSRWLQRNKITDINFHKVNNPVCLSPELIPFDFRQRILEANQSLSPIVQEVLVYQQPTVDLNLFEQYNYLKQYFSRTGINPMNTTNKLFGEYWSWLEGKFK